MFLSYQGFPEEGELVVCTITKIHYHSVFAKLNHYPGKSGLLHISEIAPGRIRNINDYVKEGKVVVLRVLRTSKDRGHIDLSLRRVSESQRIKKMSQIKREQKAEKIIEDAAKEIKGEPKKLYEKIQKATAADYDGIYDAFFDIAVNDEDPSIIGADEKETKALVDLIKQRIKQPMVELKGSLKIYSYHNNGVQIIRDALSEADGVDERLTVRYAGAGTYTVRVVTQEFKEAENMLKKALDKVNAHVDNKLTFMEFEREEGRELVKQ